MRSKEPWENEVHDALVSQRRRFMLESTIPIYAKRLAQTPHTGDIEQDTATYQIILLDFYKFIQGKM